MIEKLVALVPPPYVHLSRYFGVLSSHSQWRRQIVLRPEVKKGFVAGSAAPERMTWSRLLARVFKIDISRCRACSARMNPEDCEVVTEPALVSAIMAALGLATHLPARGLPRGPPEMNFDIEQREAYLDDDT